jgi:tetratricopeptide (TPR) repeat protein
MKKKLCTVVLLVAAMFVSVSTVIAGGESEHQRAKTAEKMFLAKQYEKAAPLYAQLVSSNPKNYKYNYYYGICLTIIGKDKSQALPYLEAALQHPKTPEEIYYYIGRALHYNLSFR